MLADKLVNNLAYDTDREVQNLELLKLRFGESSMHHCEIMVRLFNSILPPTRVSAEGLLTNQILHNPIPPPSLSTFRQFVILL